MARETAEDLARLQDLLDDSYASAGAHLRSIITPERRLDAPSTVALLEGMTLLNLATVTRDGRPLVGPVDGIFYRGEFWFGSAPTSLRFRHIRERPAVSASHVPSEAYQVTVHGRATIEGFPAALPADLAEVCEEIYGEGWREWGDEAIYARIEPERMFTFHIDVEAEEAAAEAAPEEA